MSKPPPPAPTASAIGPCPTVIKIVGRPGTGSLPSTIAPPDHPKIGNNVIQAMPGNNVFDYSFKKSSQVVTQTTIPSVTLDGETVQGDPQLLFQRLTAAAQRSVENIPQVFTYELCSVPSSLFDTSRFIRQPQKPALADAVWSLETAASVKH